MRLNIVVFLLVATGVVFAQSDRGTITGTIADPAGAVVANAPIEARNVETGAAYPGRVRPPAITPSRASCGELRGHRSVPGFKKYIRQGLTVQAAQTIRVDVALEVGSASESITITEVAPCLLRKAAS